MAQFKSYHTTTPNGYNLQISYDTHDTRLNLAIAVNPRRGPIVPPSSPERVDTLIVGAGPAGLAVGAVLRRAYALFTMLERSTMSPIRGTSTTIGFIFTRQYAFQRCRTGHFRARTPGFHRANSLSTTSPITPACSTSSRSWAGMCNDVSGLKTPRGTS